MDKEKILEMIANASSISDISAEIDLYEQASKEKDILVDSLKKSNSELASMLTAKVEQEDEVEVEDEIEEDKDLMFEDFLLDLI